jgi:hypothetical protein
MRTAPSSSVPKYVSWQRKYSWLMHSRHDQISTFHPLVTTECTASVKATLPQTYRNHLVTKNQNTGYHIHTCTYTHMIKYGTKVMNDLIL